MANRLCLALEISRRCNLNCRHCIAGSGPFHRHVMPQGLLNSVIDQIASDKQFHPHVTLTGGEPMLFPERVKETISYADKKGVEVHIVTNGFWGKNLEKARSILSYIGNLHLIEISTDIFHQEFVDFEAVLNAAKACMERKIKVHVRGIHFGFTDADEKNAVRRLQKQVSKVLSKKLKVTSQPLVVGGRVDNSFDSLPIRLSSRIPEINTCMILKSFFVTSYGDVHPCCSLTLSVKGPEPYIVGNVNEDSLKTIAQRVRKAFVPNILCKYGVKGLLRVIQSIKGRDYVRKFYTNIQKDDSCQVCARIFADSQVMSLFGGVLGKNGSFK